MNDIRKLITRLYQSGRRWVRKAWRLASGGSTHFEVERKYAISKDEFNSLPTMLTARGFSFEGIANQTDTFLPTVNEDDMNRVRVETIKGHTSRVLTIKTWEIVKGDRERKESEEKIGELTARTLIDLGRRQKGSDLLSYSKKRNLYTASENDIDVTVSLDTVENLGEYSGHYMEVEVLVAPGGDVDGARRYILTLVKTLFGEERQFVQLSYMQMLKRTTAQKAN